MEEHFCDPKSAWGAIFINKDKHKWPVVKSITLID